MSTLNTYRFTVMYVAFSELLYMVYEWQLPGDPHSGNALALGLLLVALSVPAGLTAGWTQWHAGILLGYPPGDTHAFWPRFIAWQTALLINAVLFALLTRRRLRRVLRRADGTKTRNDV